MEMVISSSSSLQLQVAEALVPCSNVNSNNIRLHHNISAHSLLPICTNLEQHLANAKNSSSPENIEETPTLSADNPFNTHISNIQKKMIVPTD
jgi:hypothetical protein